MIIMIDWDKQLKKLNFDVKTRKDGSSLYTLSIKNEKKSYWTKITVKQVGKPDPDAWQVTYARSELQVGIWKIFETTKDIKVVVHNSEVKMIDEIKNETSLKPDFFSRF